MRWYERTLAAHILLSVVTMQGLVITMVHTTPKKYSATLRRKNSEFNYYFLSTVFTASNVQVWQHQKHARMTQVTMSSCQARRCRKSCAAETSTQIHVSA